MQTVAAIREVRRFPVKSMRGESLPAATVTLQGVIADRRYAFVQKASRSSFPWLTARELPDMLRYHPTVEHASAKEVEVTVTTPEGKKFPIQSDALRELLESRSGRELFLLYDYRGSFDVAPISVISRQTIARIAEESQTVEDPLRFRPNVLIDLEGGEAFEELNWVGRIVHLGDTARIAIIKVDERCMMITLDPETAKPSTAILRSVVQQHNQCAGVYAAVLTPGEIRVGDKVSLEF